MKIKTNPTIDAFFSRCRYHLTHETKNDFLGMQVSSQNELEICQKMKEAGFAEFMGPQKDWPSLFIKTKDYLKSPYQSHIKFDQIKGKEFRFTKETMPSHELFSVSSIHPDPNRELSDWMTLRALDESYQATFLWQGQEVWMMDAPSEANTMDPYAKKAHGNVLTFGLGIGYFIYMAMLNPEVKSITVIEKSKAVIDLFDEVLRPQFLTHIPINIIEGDAFNFFDQDFLNDYDYVFVDIWKSNEDGYKLIEKLLEQVLPDFDKVDFWIESSCFEFMPALIYLYFDALAYHKSIKHPVKVYQRVHKKIIAYFDQIEETIDDVDQLKHYMYDPHVLRSIAAITI
ncbi:MAG: Uncharacterized protein FD133_1555 [Erysipelotrichaceae bacterium]|nr:MAG: Uncharacterized protein FD133_1555 [Erysipelotrichaceae bacterium]